MIFSIVSPVFQAKEILSLLVDKIEESLNNLSFDYEIILVDDGSTDGGWVEIERLCTAHSTVKGIKLSRNFGQHNAILAGVSKAQGKYVVVMDCDLQDNPDDILPLYEKAKQGFEIVFTKRTEQKHAYFKRIASKLFYVIFTRLLGRDFGQPYGSLVLFANEILPHFLSLKDSMGNYIQTLEWLHRKNTYLEVEHQTRHSGSSSYNFSKLLRLGLVTVMARSTNFFAIWICSFSVTTLLTCGLFYLLKSDYCQMDILNSVMVSFFFFILLFSIGIHVVVLSFYIHKSLDESKQKPFYLIEKTLNLGE